MFFFKRNFDQLGYVFSGNDANKVSVCDWISLFKGEHSCRSMILRETFEKFLFRLVYREPLDKTPIFCNAVAFI